MFASETPQSGYSRRFPCDRPLGGGTRGPKSRKTFIRDRYLYEETDNATTYGKNVPTVGKLSHTTLSLMQPTNLKSSVICQTETIDKNTKEKWEKFTVYQTVTASKSSLRVAKNRKCNGLSLKYNIS